MKNGTKFKYVYILPTALIVFAGVICIWVFQYYFVSILVSINNIGDVEIQRRNLIEKYTNSKIDRDFDLIAETIKTTEYDNMEQFTETILNQTCSSLISTSTKKQMDYLYKKVNAGLKFYYRNYDDPNMKYMNSVYKLCNNWKNNYNDHGFLEDENLCNGKTFHQLLKFVEQIETYDDFILKYHTLMSCGFDVPLKFEYGFETMTSRETIFVRNVKLDSELSIPELDEIKDTFNYNVYPKRFSIRGPELVVCFEGPLIPENRFFAGMKEMTLNILEKQDLQVCLEGDKTTKTVLGWIERNIQSNDKVKRNGVSFLKLIIFKTLDSILTDLNTMFFKTKNRELTEKRCFEYIKRNMETEFCRGLHKEYNFDPAILEITNLIEEVIKEKSDMINHNIPKIEVGSCNLKTYRNKALESRIMILKRKNFIERIFDIRKLNAFSRQKFKDRDVIRAQYPWFSKKYNTITFPHGAILPPKYITKFSKEEKLAVIVFRFYHELKHWYDENTNGGKKLKGSKSKSEEDYCDETALYETLSYANKKGYDELKILMFISIKMCEHDKERTRRLIRNGPIDTIIKF